MNLSEEERFDVEMLNQLLLERGFFKRELAKLLGISEAILNQVLKRHVILPELGLQKLARLHRRLKGPPY